MSDTTFSNGTVITSDWLNDVNTAVYKANSKFVSTPSVSLLDTISSFVSVKAFGAIGDGTTDDTLAIQAAIDYCVAQDKALFIPATTSSYLVSGTGVKFTGPLVVYGEGEGSYIRNTSGNACRVQGSLLKFYNLKFGVATGGHVIVQSGNVDQAFFDCVSLEQYDTAYSCWDNAGFMYIDVHWTHFRFQHVLSATVPGFNLVATGGTINDNSWKDGRVTNSGNYFWNVETTSDNFQYANIWDTITFEVCVGGGIRQVGAYNFLIANCQNWDAQVSGPVLKHFYSVEKHPSYNRGGRGKFSNCGRWAGVNDTNIYDISTPISGLGSGIIIETCYAIGTGITTAFTADLKNNSAVILGTISGQFQGLNDSGAVYAGGSIFQTSAGLKFTPTLPASTDLHTFDRYEESDPAALPIPLIIGTTTAGTATYTTQKCSYTVLGNVVSFQIVISWTGHTGTGNMMVITGIPYNASSTVANYACNVIPSNITFTGMLCAYVVSGSNQIIIGQATSGAGFAPTAVAAAGSFTISGQYCI